MHKYLLDTSGLKILDFQEKSILAWLAELMKHRPAADSKRYRLLSEKFIEKYGISTEGYDVIKGWRANASYFYIAKAFVRDEIDVDILEELLSPCEKTSSRILSYNSLPSHFILAYCSLFIIVSKTESSIIPI